MIRLYEWSITTWASSGAFKNNCAEQSAQVASPRFVVKIISILTFLGRFELSHSLSAGDKWHLPLVRNKHPLAPIDDWRQKIDAFGLPFSRCFHKSVLRMLSGELNMHTTNLRKTARDWESCKYTKSRSFQNVIFENLSDWQCEYWRNMNFLDRHNWVET